MGKTPTPETTTCRSSDLLWFDVEPFYVFHPMSAYDEGNTIVLDVVRNLKIFERPHRSQRAATTMDGWTVDLADSKVREARFDDRAQSFRG